MFPSNQQTKEHAECDDTINVRFHVEKSSAMEILTDPLVIYRQKKKFDLIKKM